MRHVHESDIQDELAFAKRAAAKFAADPSVSTFTDESIARGCFFAVRWGLGDDCVLVLKLDEVHEPAIYAQQIRRAQQE